MSVPRPSLVARTEVRYGSFGTGFRPRRWAARRLSPHLVLSYFFGPLTASPGARRGSPLRPGPPGMPRTAQQAAHRTATLG